MNILLIPLLKILMIVITALRWSLVAYAILSWLIAFNIITLQNMLVFQINDLLKRIIEPMLRPLRRVIPNPVGIDLSFFVLFLIVIFVENVLIQTFFRFMVEHKWHTF